MNHADPESDDEKRSSAYVFETLADLCLFLSLWRPATAR